MVQTEFQVTGMTCAHCEGSVQTEIGKIPGVQNVHASAANGSVVVESATALSREAVAEAVTEAGYELV